MSSAGLRLFAGSIVSLLLAGSATARADSPIVAQLEMRAAATCATREQLMARVLARSPRIQFVETGSGDTMIRATIAAGAGSAVVGDLVVAPPTGKATTRRLTAATCAEATEALALVIAIALDPTFTTEPAAPVDSSSAPPSAPVPRPPATPPPATAPALARVAGSPEAPPATRRFGVGATVGALLGPAPRAMAAFGAYLAAEVERDSVWSPAIALSFRHASATGLVEPGGTAAFTLDALGLDACALRLRLFALEARACAAGLAGRLMASGSETYSAMAHTRAFASVGGSALLSADLGRFLVLSGRLGATASLMRDAFEFTPEVFHRVASVTLEGEIGLGLRFP